MILLSDLFREVFPDYETFPEHCVIREAIESGERDFLSDVLSIIHDAGQMPEFKYRLRLTHPAGRIHPGELEDAWDDHLERMTTEGLAFAWACTIGNLGRVGFTDDNGTPDLVTDGKVWIEAKTLGHSQEMGSINRAQLAAGRRGYLLPSPVMEISNDGLAPVTKKFLDHLADARRKRDRQPVPMPLVVFYRVDFDFTLESREKAKQSLRATAQTEHRRDGVRIVMCHRYDWAEPFVDTID
ncbi:MAG: hypothetical protein C4558_06665 [Dehalococcoidia bacterium]|nr:MAG: hypothetical protein C4558_06665 [Dehalococcoidia bacterium]